MIGFFSFVGCCALSLFGFGYLALAVVGLI